MLALLLSFLQSGHNFSHDERELNFKFRFANILLLIAVFLELSNSILFGLKPQYEGLYLSEVALSSALLFFMTILLLRLDKKKFTLVISLAFLTFLINLTHTLWMQYDNTVRIIWFVVPTLLSTILLTPLLQRFIFLYSVAAVLFFIIQNSVPLHINTTTIISSVYIALIVIAYSVLVHIKQSHDTKDLKKQNYALDQQIKIEVEKNLQKDKILLQQSRLVQMGELLSMIAHQWRQPLSTIGSATSTALLQLEIGDYDPKELQDVMKHVEGNIQKLSNTITQFQSHFKPEHGITQTSFEELEKNIDQFFKEYLGDADIKFSSSVPKDIHFATYKDELVNVILNLLFNSLESLHKKRPEHPAIHIDMRQDGNNYLIEIADNGSTLTPEIKAQMFDPYYSTKQEKNGTGLGLYVSKMIIEKHCLGTLTVETQQNSVIARIKIPSLA